MDNRKAYLEPVLRELPRLISWQDRERLSITYGACDRTYWCWKFTDFPGARFQETAYALAAVATGGPEVGEYSGSEAMIGWTRAALRYWQTIQYGDGSFDEAYPFERSLAATAFTGFYLGEAFLLIEDRIPAEEAASLRATFRAAGDWLCRNDERHGVLSNHLAVAAAALETIRVITGDVRFHERSDYFLERIFSHQSEEGWYEEYGGADPGYQSHGTFYLACIWRRTGSDRLLDSLRRSVRWLAHFIHPNRTLGGEYASRNTEFYFPAGFEILADVCEEARAIADFMRPGLEGTVGLSAMDAYNYLPLMNNYLFAARAVKDRTGTAPPLPCHREMEVWFPEAGLYVRRTPHLYAVVGLSKGGPLRAYDPDSGELLAAEAGYWGTVRDSSKIVTSQNLQHDNARSVEGGRIVVESQFAEVNQRVQSPWQFIPFRLFTTTVGRIPGLAYAIKRLLVWVLVSRRKPVPLTLRREIEFQEDGIEIRDVITAESGAKIESLYAARKFTSIHMGSSRYYHRQELSMTPIETRVAGGDLPADSPLERETRIPLRRAL